MRYALEIRLAKNEKSQQPAHMWRASISTRIIALLFATSTLLAMSEASADDRHIDDAKVETSLTHYESVRNALAHDNMHVEKLAEALRKSLTDASMKADKESKSQLEKAAHAAKSLSTMNKSKANAVRKAFGEVSRHLVALIRRFPTLQQGRFLFHCPMAQDYEKWFQTSREMANPYMGTRMLKCGSKRDW